MKTTTSGHQQAWEAAFKGGSARAVQRATISRVGAFFTPYDLSAAESEGQGGSGRFCSLLFNQQDQPVELPNVESITWTRSADNDAATCTITLTNSEPLPAGQVPVGSEVALIDRPGFYTYNRGMTAEGVTRWGHEPNGWRDLIRPDRMIRTFEGWGTDGPEVAPELDTHLYPSGVWFIDDVTFPDGKIVLECRDAGRWLIDQIALPPSIPYNRYPLTWESYHLEDGDPVVSTSLATNWFRPAYDTDSNIPYIGRGITDGAKPYVDSKGGVRGHRGLHAFDSSNDTYWLSVGNYPNWSSAFEYVQGKFSARNVSAVRIRTWGGPYKVYVSVKTADGWKGTKKIPYRARSVDTNADIKFVVSKKVKKNGVTEIVLPKSIAGATRVRITFTDLYDSGIGEYQYRAGCRDIQVLAGTSSTTTTTPQVTVGTYGDYTDIVKWMCAWGGLHWPIGAELHYSDDSTESAGPVSSDPVLRVGRAWGDFEQTGTAGVADFDAQSFDKKPFMDVISTIRDIIGYNFHIDELGGAVWRSPNIWSLGNYLWMGGPNDGRTTDMITIDDEQTLLSIRPKLTSRNVRDWVFVANTSGLYGAVSAGYNPVDVGIKRVGGWTDQNFTSEDECQLMADLITIRQMVEYETVSLTIPGNSAIQVDDQVRIYDQVTGWTDVALVKSVKSTWERLTGRWVYDLDLHWLGESPGERWITNDIELAQVTKTYLALMNRL